MVVTLFSSLVRLALTLLFLPLRLIAIPFRLIGLPIAVLMLPIHIITRLLFRHTFAVILLVLALLVFMHFKSNPGALPQLAPAPAPTLAQQQAPKGALAVEQVRRYEDGDSNFATDLYATMSDYERAEYSRNFYWAMANLPDKQVHGWVSGNIAGSIRANDTFANKLGVRCRHFNEVLKVHAIQQTISGTACDQFDGSWCKLKPNATAGCGLGGHSRGLLDSIGSAFQGLF